MQFQLSPTPHQRRIRRIPTITLQTMKHIRGNCMRNSEGGGAWRGTPEPQAPPAWRAPEGPKGLAAVLVGGGGAWPGFEATRRAKLAARTARGRAAAHGHIKQPGPTRQATRRPEHQRRHKQRKRAAAHQGRRAFTQLDQTLNTVESANTQHNRERKHSAQSRARVLSAVAGPPPRRPGPR